MKSRDFLLVALAAALILAAHRLGTRRLDTEIARRDSVISALAERTQQTDTVYRVQRDTLTRTVTRWRTLLDTLTDTLTVRESTIVAAADTAIRACLVTLTTCETRVAQRDSTIVLQQQQIRAWERKARPCRIGPIPCPVFGPGVVTDGTTVKPGFAVIIPL